MFYRTRKRAAQQQWAEWETDDYVRATIREVQRRQAAGDRRAAKHVALEALEEVWVQTHFQRLANLAYKRTLAIGRQAGALGTVSLNHGGDDEPAGPDGPWQALSSTGSGQSPRTMWAGKGTRDENGWRLVDPEQPTGPLQDGTSAAQTESAPRRPVKESAAEPARVAAQPALPAVSRRCACGHAKQAHQHYRRGTDCALCECKKFNRPLMPRLRRWLP